MKITFVCLGNICRSPSAEAVMNSVVEEAGLEEFIMCDSAGTYGYHAGQNADARMQSHAIKRGYDLTSISRKIIKDDFKDFDYIIAMDNSNYVISYNGQGQTGGDNQIDGQITAQSTTGFTITYYNNAGTIAGVPPSGLVVHGGKA